MSTCPSFLRVVDTDLHSADNKPIRLFKSSFVPEMTRRRDTFSSERSFRAYDSRTSVARQIGFSKKRFRTVSSDRRNVPATRWTNTGRSQQDCCGEDHGESTFKRRTVSQDKKTMCCSARFALTFPPRRCKRPGGKVHRVPGNSTYVLIGPESIPAGRRTRGRVSKFPWQCVRNSHTPRERFINLPDFLVCPYNYIRRDVCARGVCVCARARDQKP